MASAKNTKQASNNIVSKQKTLLPTLKEQQRYVVYKVLAADKAKQLSQFDKINNDILVQCNLMLGIFDGGHAGLMNAKYNSEKMTGILRVNNKYVDKLKVCLGMIKNSNGIPIVVDCIYVSGVINKAIDKMNS
ncbi:MAG TPA: Rpp14/Pop5 family protein [Alphaproteobacteria bacterium]|nr:Rpp14/Pop5 family protein [Alphaproteobacteria bacterium]